MNVGVSIDLLTYCNRFASGKASSAKAHGMLEEA